MATANKKVKLVEHSGEEHITEVSGYDAKATHTEIKAAQNNETSDYTVVIGDVIIDARSIKSVSVIVPE